MPGPRMRSKENPILARIDMIDANWLQSRLRILFWIVGPLAAAGLENDQAFRYANYGYIN